MDDEPEPVMGITDHSLVALQKTTARHEAVLAVLESKVAAHSSDIDTLRKRSHELMTSRESVLASLTARGEMLNVLQAEITRLRDASVWQGRTLVGAVLGIAAQLLIAALPLLKP